MDIVDAERMCGAGSCPSQPCCRGSCRSRSGWPPSTPTGTLIVALPLDPNSINPPNAAERMAGNVVNQIFDSLLAVDNATGELLPSLANGVHADPA